MEDIRQLTTNRYFHETMTTTHLLSSLSSLWFDDDNEGINWPVIDGSICFQIWERFDAFIRQFFIKNNSRIPLPTSYQFSDIAYILHTHTHTR